MSDSRTNADEAVDTLQALVARRYGDRLTPAELAGVRQGIETVVEMSRALRAVKVTNSDEPMPPFVPFRAEP